LILDVYPGYLLEYYLGYLNILKKDLDKRKCKK